ncbi:MAG TPA: T9SS type A sorting domain-containing protein, partial [Bacteroidetes bacterium]|nr:T9SS type A sorting domain-containing protein [Bacteroidota bacterium]
YWDVAANKGLDTYTVDWGGWNTVLVCGWGVASMTTRDWTNSVYANAIDNGINFIFSDMDYFYSNGEDAEPVFAEGDLAYDLFGIQGGTNDPQPTDSTFFGEDGDPISGAFVDEAYTTYPNLYSGDWADFVEPAAGATTFFIGAEQGNPMAIRKENGDQKAVYFAFDIFSACEDDGEGNLVPTDDFNTLMDDLLTYIGPEVAVGEDNSAPVPQTFVLDQNYPNPFNPSTTISFVVPRVEQVRLTVFNVNGRQVATLFDGAMTPGAKSITFNAGDLASGIYFYRLDAGSFTATRKMVLMK